MWFVHNVQGYIGLSITTFFLLFNIKWQLYLESAVSLWPPIIALSCLFQTAFRSPGIISTKAHVVKEPSEKQLEILEKYAPNKNCNVITPPHCHYSHALKDVVIDYDHFCMWANNGIGLLNIRYFIQFVAWTFISSVCTVGTIYVELFKCYTGDKHSCNWIFYRQNYMFPHILYSLGFGWFAFSIFKDQYVNLHEGLTSVDKIKDVKVKRIGSWERFFGDYTIGKFLPTPNSQKLIDRGIKTVESCVEQLKSHEIHIIRN